MKNLIEILKKYSFPIILIIILASSRIVPHPHNFTDRRFRPGDQAFFDILHSFNGYRTCYYRTFNVGRASVEQTDAYKQCREWLDNAIDLIKPGVSTDKIASVWPKAEEFGFDNEMDAFALQFGHGGLSDLNPTIPNSIFIWML